MINFKVKQLNATALALVYITVFSSQKSYGMEENPRDCFSQSVQTTSIDNFTKITEGKLKNIGKGDVVFFDIDGVLLSKGGNKNNALLISREVLSFLKELRKKQVSCFGLTARSHNQQIATFNNLNQYGINFDKKFHIDFLDSHAKYYKGILFSPDHKEKEKVSTKLDTLSNFLDCLKKAKQPIKRAIFVDDQSFHFTQKNKIPNLHCFEFKRKFYPLYSFTETAEAPSLPDLTYVETKAGGSGGVIVLQDSNGKKWTLKNWESRGHGINECLGASLYKKMGYLSPNFFLYDDLPPEFKEMLKEKACKLATGGLYRLAEYIEGHAPDMEELTKLGEECFLPTALISFWDVKPENYMINKEGKLYLIDSGGAFFTRARGVPKKEGEDDWTPHQVSELFSFKNSKILGHSVFSNVDIRKIRSTFEKILSLRTSLLEETNKFCEATFYPDKSKALHFMESRLNHLEFLKDYYVNKFNVKADPFALAGGEDSAGTLIYTMINGKRCVLLAKRRGHKWWGNFGGKANKKEFFHEAAARETKEESGGVIDIGCKIQFCPSHDSIEIKEDVLLKRYRTYLVKSKYIDPQNFNDEEHTEFKWIPVEEILDTLNNPSWIQEENEQTLQLKDGTILYPPLVKSLQQFQIKNWLTHLNDINEKTPISPTCTQSIIDHENLIPLEKESLHSNSDRERFILALTSMAQKKERLKKENLSTKNTIVVHFVDNLS